MRARSALPETLIALREHPRIEDVQQDDEVEGLQFEEGSAPRIVRIGEAEDPLYGLPELMDNNPLVCADSMSVPTNAESLALICLGPLLLAGLAIERPGFITNLDCTSLSIDAALGAAGWSEGVDLHVEPFESGGVGVATAMAVIQTPSDPTDLEDLYDERFGRSYFVRRWTELAWDPELVLNKPFALYKLSIVVDEPTSLVTIRAMCDAGGRYTAAQLIGAMNVMSGFEETLGITL